MMTHPLTLTVECAGAEQIISLEGELDIASVELIHVTIDALATEGYRKVVFDLDELTFIDSNGIRALVQAQRCIRGDGRVMEVVNVGRSVKRVIDILGLSDALNVQNGYGSGVEQRPLNVSAQSARH